MARPTAAGGGEHYSIPMPTAGVDAASGDDGMQRSAPEEALNWFVRSVAFVEWVGNALGLLSFTWATAVLLGGFCSSLNVSDLWFATVIMFTEAFRIFSRGYTMDNHSLFGTTRAVTWIRSSFARRLARPQEGNEVVLIMGLWNNFAGELTALINKQDTEYLYGETISAIFNVSLLLVISKLQLGGAASQLENGPRRRRQLHLWAALITTVPIAAYNSSIGIHLLPATLANIVTMVVAVLLLSLRPRCIANQTTSPFGRTLLSLAKVTSALWLAVCSVAGGVLVFHPSAVLLYYLLSLSIPFTTLVLSVGSLQKQSPAISPLHRMIDVIMHVLFLFNLVMPIPPFLFNYWYEDDMASCGLPIVSSMILLGALLFGNLQIPAAVLQALLSSWRLHKLLTYQDYDPQPEDRDINLVPMIAVFYVLALCQGALYIMACIIGVFSFFPRRSLVRRLKLCGQQGAKAIDLYYQDAYATRTKIGVLSPGNRISLTSFAMDSLCSGSSEMELAGVIVLDNLLQESHPSSEELIPRITSSYKEVSTLISMLSWTGKQDRDTRLFAARVTAKLAGSVRIARFPGLVNMVSSLLDAENNQPEEQHPLLSDGGNGGCSWARGLWQQMKEKWSLPKDDHPSTHQNSLPVLGMVILEKLARDHDNCAEIFKATSVISKIIGLMSYSTNDERSQGVQQNAVIYSSLNFVRQLGITGDKIGAALRQELQKNPFLLNNLAGILEDTRSNPQQWKPAMDIISKLALDKRAGKEIGHTQEIIGKLMHAFLARCGPANIDDDQSLPMVAGEALTNLAIWGAANCSAILEEPGYEVIKDLKNMLYEEEYRYVTANLLQNLCAHCRVKLSHPDVSEHLSSALTIVMEHIEAAEGKQLESLVSLTSEISGIIREAFVQELESQTNNGVGLVKKLVSTLNFNKKPNPEYPRMRRVIVKSVITILESCHRTVEKMMEEVMMEGLMEALIKIERTPSKVEKYRVFYGSIGVVLESGEPMSALVARAKALIRRIAQTAGGR